MQFRFCSWNLRGLGPQWRHMADLIREIRPDIIALQEVTLANFEAFARRIELDSAACSLHLRAPQPGEGRGRGLGCAIFARTPFEITSKELIDTAPLPERTLIAQLTSPAGPLTACSFHAPPGVTWKELKPQSFLAIADFLSQHPGRTVFGMDANTPKVDRIDLAENVWWWKDEPSLLGTGAGHALTDVLRTILAREPQRLAALQSARPMGPLALSFRRGPKGKAIDCRYDFVFATPDIVVRDVAYFYEKSIAAGSDHAMVVADLELSAASSLRS